MDRRRVRVAQYCNHVAWIGRKLVSVCSDLHLPSPSLSALENAEVEAQVPERKAIHAIVDNYATHKHPKVRAWLARHPRWTFHFTPTSASWLNAVEVFFAKLTRRSHGLITSSGQCGKSFLMSAN
jgi:transposase